MLIRLLLALVLALGAMPMAAPCHGAAASGHGGHAAMAAHHHPSAPVGDHHRDPASIGHGCIGCAALDDWLAERVAPPLALPAIGPDARQPRLAKGATAPPTLRPPRIG